MVSAGEGTRPRSWWRDPPAGLSSGALLIAGALLAVLVLHTPPDVRLYWEYGGRLLGRAYAPGYTDWVQHSLGQPSPVSSAVAGPSLAPYSRFHCEYPPGALLIFALVRLVADSPASFGYAFAAGMALLMLATMYLSGRLAVAFGGVEGPARWATSAAVVALPLLMGALLIRRFDIVPAFLTVAAMRLLLAGRPSAAGAMLGLGGAIKLWPALIVPLVALQLWRTGRHREALGCALAGAAGFLLPHLATFALGTQPGDMLGYLTYLRDRPVQIESVIGSLEIILAKLTGVSLVVSHDFGSDNIVWPSAGRWIGVATVVNMLALLGTFAAIWVRTRRAMTPAETVPMLIAAAGVIVVATALCSRVFSGEYLIWFIPFALALAGRRFGPAALVAFVASCAALRASYHVWDALVALRWSGVLLSALKSLCLALVGTLFAAMLARDRAPA